MTEPAPPDPARPDPEVVVQLRGVSVHTHHGVGAAEREVGQRMVFDLDLTLAGCDAAVSDDLAGTVDYAEVTALLINAATEQSYQTLERLTRVIADRVMSRFEVSRVRVRASKPEPPIPVTMDGAAVDLTLKRAAD
ncbi:MAG: dihydroneopterin aldolase [Thermoleophilia bacterium]|nr:dihydroneopterin aldolase [Thermoleophilia bacterium]